MSESRDEKIMKIVDQAIELDASARADFLDSACASDPMLRADVEKLLKLETEAGDAFDAGAKEIENLPSQIGPYRLLDVIGEGGMGVVWRAEQREPIKRIVAVKLIKLGMDTHAVVARFESERQALAMMNHPNVASVFDAGATLTGRPYFVMEYVAGEPITGFCDRHNYSVRQRLELFLQACEAVQHAHTKAILHRDLKPSNILVTVHNDKPLVKVIDFGVAKATAQRLTEKTVFTETGQMIGTPEYMSPEQAEMITGDIDTRSDVYSLGVVLYELLIGALPVDAQLLRSAGYREIQRRIVEMEAPRPSTRLSTLADRDEIAKRRQTVIDDLTRVLRGELEWIPLKALRKERSQRYTTADQFADDIRNYLGNRPLIAGPESARYRARKFLRRNRVGVTVSIAMISLLLAGIAATTWQAVKANRARRQAEDQFARAELNLEVAQSVGHFLVADVLGGARPEVIPDKAVRDTIVSAMIDPAAATVHTRFQTKPLVEASIRESLAETYKALGRADLAVLQSAAALEIRRKMLGDDDPFTIRSIGATGFHLIAMGKLDEAEPLLREAMERARRVNGPDDRSTINVQNNLAGLLREQGKLPEAELQWKECLERSRRVLGANDQLTLQTLNNVGFVLQAQGRNSDAEPFFRECLETRRRILKDDHPDTMVSINNLASVLKAGGKLDEAAAMQREAVDRGKRVLGDDHPQTIAMTMNLADTLRLQGKVDEAELLLRDCLDRNRRLLGREHPDTLVGTANLGALYLSQSKYAQAEPLFAELFEVGPRAQVSPLYKVMYTTRYGICLAKLGKYPRARDALTTSYQKLKSAGLEKHPRTLEVLSSLIEACEHTDRPDEAAKYRAEVQALTPASKPAK